MFGDTYNDVANFVAGHFVHGTNDGMTQTLRLNFNIVCISHYIWNLVRLF